MKDLTIKIKEIINDEVCLGTAGLVELEIENYFKSQTQEKEQLIYFLTWHESENLGSLSGDITGRVEEYLNLLK